MLARGAQTSLTNCGSCLFCMLRGLVRTVPTRTPISSRSMLHSGVVRTATFEALIYSKQSRQILSSNFLLKKKKKEFDLFFKPATHAGKSELHHKNWHCHWLWCHFQLRCIVLWHRVAVPKDLYQFPLPVIYIVLASDLAMTFTCPSKLRLLGAGLSGFACANRCRS